MIDRGPRMMCLAVTIGVVWASTAAAQGLYWESTTTGIGTQPRTAQVYAVPKMFKLVQQDGRAVIVTERKLITMDTTKHTYHEMDIAGGEGKAQGTQRQMDRARAKLEQRMKELPPEQRAAIEKMLPNLAASTRTPVPVTVSRTDETKTINGYACTKYVAKQGDKTILVAWTTKDVKGFDALRDDWLKFRKRTSSLSPMARGVADAYALIEGFPIETEMGTVKTEVTKVEGRAIPASTFQIPAGYKLASQSVPGAHH